MNPAKIRPFCEQFFALLKHRKGEDLLIFEKSTQMLYDLSQHSPLFLKEFKKNILEVFDSDDFFNCSVTALKTWSRIIDATLDANKLDILSDHLEAVNFTSMFWSKSSEDKLRIKSFQRICFIIYSG